VALISKVISDMLVVLFIGTRGLFPSNIFLSIFCFCCYSLCLILPESPLKGCEKNESLGRRKWKDQVLTGVWKRYIKEEPETEE
jgi:hypothetical protein